jgi:hypothetical protein
MTRRYLPYFGGASGGRGGQSRAPAAGKATSFASQPGYPSWQQVANPCGALGFNRTSLDSIS